MEAIGVAGVAVLLVGAVPDKREELGAVRGPTSSFGIAAPRHPLGHRVATVGAAAAGLAAGAGAGPPGAADLGVHGGPAPVLWHPPGVSGVSARRAAWAAGGVRAGDPRPQGRPVAVEFATKGVVRTAAEGGRGSQALDGGGPTDDGATYAIPRAATPSRTGVGTAVLADPRATRSVLPPFPF